MEFYQSCQNRTNQTISVVNAHIPGLTVGGVNTAALSSLCNNLDTLAQARDNKVADEDTARNAENLGYVALRTLTMALPKAAEGELNDEVPAEEKLLSHLDEVYAITPRTSESAVARGRKLVAALGKINPWLAAQLPARGPITSGGKGLVDLNAALDMMPVLEQALSNAETGSRDARTDLRQAATALDKLNKRFYKKLVGEARTNETLAEALGQIDTDSQNLPETLSILSVLQAGEGFLSLHVSYVTGTGSDAETRSLEWRVDVETGEFTNSVEVDLSGNLIGPFAVGQTIYVRTRTTNSNGTRTSAIRRLTLVPV